MFSPARDDEAEKTNSCRRKKFLFACDDISDDEEAMGMRALVRATHEDHAEIDVVEQTLRDTLEESWANVDQHPEDSQGLQQHHHEEPNELFVSPEEDEVTSAAAGSDNLEIKPEPYDDDCCMVIDPTQASSGAQEKWAKPQRFTIDLTSESCAQVKKENPIEEAEVKTEPTAAAAAKPQLIFAQNDSNSSLRSGRLIQLVKMRDDLKSRATSGNFSESDWSELFKLNNQIAEESSAAIETENPAETKIHEDSDEKKKRTNAGVARRPRVRNAAEFFARELEDEQRKKRKTSGTFQNPEGPKRQQREQQYLQVENMLRSNDAIQERADLGNLAPEPTIVASTKADQMQQIKENATEDFDIRRTSRQRSDIERASRTWGNKNAVAKDGKWRIKGMTTQSPLTGAQLIVGAWMLERELKRVKNIGRGGILADAMGLGKTIETLSCMIGNQSTALQRTKGEGTTLVVCPSGQFISQWISEVKKTCETRFSRRLVHYKGGGDMDVGFLSSQNIVFATYHQLRRGTPTIKERNSKQEELGNDHAQYSKWLEEKTGDLFKISWFRVVLDEAHAIKNHGTHSAFACQQLKARNRWAVTGTPMTNRAHELYSYLRFIRCEVGSFDEYLQEYRQDTNASKRKHHALLYKVMYRRTPNDLFLGRPLMNLRMTHPSHQYLKLSKEEMVIFRQMEECFRRRMNEELENGTAERNKRTYLVMLLRLRQAATHPFLLEGMMNEYFTIDDMRNVRKQLAALKGKSTIYEQIGSWSQRHKMSDERMQKVMGVADRQRQESCEAFCRDELEAFEDDRVAAEQSQSVVESEKVPLPGRHQLGPIVNDDHIDEVDSQDEVEEDADGMVPEDVISDSALREPQAASRLHRTPEHGAFQEERLVPYGQSDFGLGFDMDKHMEYLIQAEILDEARCPVCERAPKIPVKSKCGHLFCQWCLTDHLGQKKSKCPVCKKVIGRPERFKTFDDDEELDYSVPKSSSRSSGKKKRYSKGNDIFGYQPVQDDKKATRPNRFLQISDRIEGLPVTPSAKMAALKETILRWQKEAPGDKIIIFSQFIVVMEIVGRMLEDEDINFVYLSGKQTTEQRNRAVESFQTDENTKVLIASMGSGGQCLNLTRGNRVVLMELWWNHAAEQQAFARVFRFGQVKETHFVRFIVQTPVEQRMLEMQYEKIIEIDEALQDDGLHSSKVKVVDIAGLIGKVVEDDEGNIRVIADYSDLDGDQGYGDIDLEIAGAASEDEGDLEGFVVSDDEIEMEDEEEQDDVLYISDNSDEE